jgi:hypothetical protein
VSSVQNHIRLFADDALLFGPITDNKSLQLDLNSLAEWCNTWQMSFNTNKCQVLHFNLTRQDRQLTEYTLNGHKLESTQLTKYLGVNITNDLTWQAQVDYTAKKSNMLLNMLIRQLRGCNRKTKLTTYKSIVRPILEYATPAWSPYLVHQRKSLEKVQRRAVRWIDSLKGDDSITNAQIVLKLDNLTEHRKHKDAKLYEDMKNGNVNIDLKRYVSLNSTATRRRVIQKRASSATFHHSFFLRVNRLPNLNA